MKREYRLLAVGVLLALGGLLAPRVGVEGPPGGAARLVLEAVSASASFPLVAAAAVLAVVFLGRLSGGQRALLLSIIAAGILVFTLKEAAHLPRPPGAPLSLLGRVLEADRYSWPSGHSAVAGAVLAHYWGSRRRALALAWALAVGASRVLLGAHYVGDVVSGLGVGIASRGLAGLAAGL